MRICSLLPSATEVVAGLGLLDELVAISHECDYPPAVRAKPVIIQSAVRPEESSSADIDQQVRAALNGAGALYRVNEILLRQINPTLIITQDLCSVCAVTPEELQRALSEIPGDPQILCLNASRLEDVFRDIEMIGAVTGRREAAGDWILELKARIKRVRTSVAAAPPRPVVCLEWLDPLYSAGHWVPELVSLAGGVDLMARAGTESLEITWDNVRRAAPHVLILMPCGFRIARTLRELDRLTARPGWKDLPAVRNGEVYAVEGPAYFNRPGPRLVNGVELLARLFHPSCFGRALPEGAQRIP
jgi:iron complex transport system substrate-binding protein